MRIARDLKEAGIPAQISGEPPLFDVVFSPEKVRDYRGTLRGNAEMLQRALSTFYSEFNHIAATDLPRV